MKTTHVLRSFALVLACAMLPGTVQGGGDLQTRFTNQQTIANTRHNMTQRAPVGAGEWPVQMDNFRNDYGEVCVYCHTPHGANASVAAPLWNRNLPATTYTTYDKLETSSLSQAVYQPGAASLPCLSCHDGQQAVDAVINMPGPGRYKATPDDGFLSGWSNASGLGSVHLGLDATTGVSCLVCHAPGTIVGATATDFTVFAIGTDLRNDHPVGVVFPDVNGANTGWNTPSGSKTIGTMLTRFFDENGNGRMDNGDIRLYDTGNGAAVECASCHDPHGDRTPAARSTRPSCARATSRAASARPVTRNKFARARLDYCPSACSSFFAGRRRPGPCAFAIRVASSERARIPSSSHRPRPDDRCRRAGLFSASRENAGNRAG